MVQQLSIVDRLVSGRAPADDSAAVADAICRDLLLLLNSWAGLFASTAAQFPMLEDCVLNYGVPSVAGRPIRDALLQEFKQEITTAIKRFEPRLKHETVEVEATLHSGPTASTQFGLRIEAELAGADSGRRLVFDSLVNTETGRVSLT